MPGIPPKTNRETNEGAADCCPSRENGVQIHYTVLGSGSAGNASLLQVDGFGLLIDAGFGPRQLATRLKVFGRTWNDVDAVLLTHAHSDHWKETTLKHLLGQRKRLYCHSDQTPRLKEWSKAFRHLKAANLVRFYDGDAMPLGGVAGPTVRAIEVSHDIDATFGFRIDCDANLFRPRWSMGYFSDLGTWTDRHVRHVADVDLLAIEFNHDVDLQRASGRPPMLVDRVLSDRGHLSNEQAADFVLRLLQDSEPGRLRNVVQLHLSRDCNRPHLARQAAERVLHDSSNPPRLQTADQDKAIRIRLAHQEAEAAAAH